MPATIARTGGANTLVVIGEPAKFENLTMLGPLLDRNARIGAYAQSIGFQVGWIFNNEGFQEAYHRNASGAWVSNISFTYPYDRDPFSIWPRLDNFSPRPGFFVKRFACPLRHRLCLDQIMM